MRFLRSRYGIRDRYGKRPAPPVVAIRLGGGGVVRATLNQAGPTFDLAGPRHVAEELQGAGTPDQSRLRRILAEAIGDPDAADREALELAQSAQRHATPPAAWSRFMAKLGLACGREAYGDNWLDSREASLLSADLLADKHAQPAQRNHHPPVSPTWPYLPPTHQLWIEPREETAILMVALFGQVLGAVRLGNASRSADPSAWSLNPEEQTFYRSTFPAIWLAHAARRIQDAGGTPYAVADPDYPFIYVPDRPDGAVDLGVRTARVDSPAHALEAVRKMQGRPRTRPPRTDEKPG